MIPYFGLFLRRQREVQRKTLRGLGDYARSLKREGEISEHFACSASTLLRWEKQDTPPSDEDIRGLSKIYNINPAIAQTWLAKGTSYPVLISPGEDRGPENRLDPSCVSISCSVLKSGQRNSVVYTHLGEEISICITGQRTIVFPDRPEGEREYTIRPGEIIHFQSEEKHYGINSGGSENRIYIIRVIAPGGVTLGSFLTEHREKALCLPLSAISREAQRMKEKGKWPTAHKNLYQLLRNVERDVYASIPNELQRALSIVYNLNEPVVAGWRPEPVEGPLVVDCERVFGSSVLEFSDKVTLEPVKPTVGEMEYLLPKYRLANSRVGIAFARMKKGIHGEEHSHLGEEINLCLSGKHVFHFPQNPPHASDLVIPPRSFIHFNSIQEHQGRNTDPKQETRLLIVRVFHWQE